MILTHGANSLKVGGGGLPTGYVQYDHIKCISVGSIYTNNSYEDAITTDISNNDTFEIGGYTTGGNDSGWLYDYVLLGMFFDSLHIRNIATKANKSANSTIFQGFNSKQVTLSSVGISYELSRTNNSVLTVNGSSVSGDGYAYAPPLKISRIFGVSSQYVGSTLSYIRVKDKSTDALKLNLIPVIKDGTTHMLYDTVNGLEFPVNATKFVCEN